MKHKQPIEYYNFCVHVPNKELADWIKQEAKRQHRPYGNFLLHLVRERWEEAKSREAQAEGAGSVVL